MGVPKFFRYISERYPCLSEVVKEYQIPEFDNLYLDMNGIIHNCSHPDDNNPHFRITEEKIFKDIFHYIEVLFRMIKPQKLFFMAVDGVAPRAKMNQQRGRRFRSAKDAEKMENEAKKKGEKLPDAERFDSNCITPGTPFMARLQEQLKYFIVEKISSDSLWQKCTVILSGHETPGEGEHKIMDYIRYIRSKPGYDPNTRHCLYGLDADLIMLGLCTHDPHFSLLREEVKFGKKSTKKISAPEEITFFLLHLSLMREYLELEFTPLKDQLKGFDFDMEKIIDDWVLMGFLVGNDFIPHLPNLHIQNGALPILYKVYMEVLPTLDGYINEGGILNLPRFEKFLEKLSTIDVDHFEEIRDDILYMEAKTGRKYNPHSEVNSKPKELVKFDEFNDVATELLGPLEPEKPSNSDLEALIQQTEDMYIDSDEPEEDDEEDDAFENYKKEYYIRKLEYAKVTPDVLRDQATGYVRAIQWNLHYYYNGVCSWSWFYPHHYAPYVSDIKGFTDLKIEFDLGKPFKPYEQLLAVLPTASKNLLPKCYHSLMTEEDSPIFKYYPRDFETDLNGKKQEWEAVVLVPFIDEKQLLEAMATCNSKLTPEEMQRNKHGPMLMYKYTENNLGPYEAPEYFGTVPENHADLETLSINDIRVPIDKLVKGAYPGVLLDVYYPGFPTMKHLNYTGQLKKASIKVFESPSRNENMIITIIPNENLPKMPLDFLGSTIFVGWPHLEEALVVGVSNNEVKYTGSSPTEYNTEKRTLPFESEVDGITSFYEKRLGVIVGNTEVLIYVKKMIGRRYVFTKNGRLTLEKQFSNEISRYPLQVVLKDIKVHDSELTTFRDILSVFPEGSTCFTIANPYYGSQGTVIDSKESVKHNRVNVGFHLTQEPDLWSLFAKQTEFLRNYKSIYFCTTRLGISNFVFSRITGSIYVTARNDKGGLKNVGIGLDLKFNKRNLETPGYSKRINTTWLFTDKTVDLVAEYFELFPEVLHFLNSRYNDKIPRVEDIFTGDNWEERFDELQKWLKTIPTVNVERQSCGSEILEPEIIAELENILDRTPLDKFVKKLTLSIKPSFLYKPDIQSGTLEPDPTMDVQLLDRVVNVRTGFTVPLGLKGTIVAVNEASSGNKRDTIYDVVFDKPFKNGMCLNCSENRGYKLPRTAFINISYGKRLLDKKIGKSNFLPPTLENHYKQFQQSMGQNSAFAAFNNDYKRQQLQQQPVPQQKVQILPRNHVNAANKIQSFNKPTPSFMPDFLNKDESKATTSNVVSNNSKTDAEMFLKNMLKIGVNNELPKKEEPTKEPPQVLFDIFSKAAKAPASVQLLTYYQSNNLGLPQYKFIQRDNQHQAQITLLSGEVISGKPAETREMAGENVAALVLDKFLNKAKQTVPAVKKENLPVPPMVWVQPQTSQQPHQKQEVKNSPHKNQKPNQSKNAQPPQQQQLHTKVYYNNNVNHKQSGSTNNKGGKASSALNNSFVPLQAIKKHISNKQNGSKTEAKKDNSNVKENKHATPAEGNKKGPDSVKDNNGKKKFDGKNKPVRKPRIAANFVQK